MLKRDAGVDLLRIVATMLVIMLHVLGQGGILGETSPNELRYWILWVLEIMAYCSVNCFALISGYVMADKKIKSKNLINLWFQVFFYSVILAIPSVVLVSKTVTVKKLLFTFFPVLSNQWWYISAYFALFCFIPFLNAAISSISKESYKKLLVVILIGICIMDQIIPADAFIIGEGYSPVWLMIVYLFGAYIKRYDLKQKITVGQSLAGFFAMILLTFLSKVMIHFTTKLVFGQVKADSIFIAYTSVTIVLASVFLMLFCLNVNINRIGQKLIAFFAPATLGVYLIHVNPFVYRHILGDAFVSFANMPTILMLLGVFAAIIMIFLVCSAIDLLRIKLFKIIKLSRLCEIIDSKITFLYTKLFSEEK